MKVYTKKGDKARTGILGESDVPKHHIRIEAYGTVDELNVLIGALRDHDIADQTKSFLVSIQENLFTIGSHLASNPQKSKIKLPDLQENWVEALENAIDEMESTLPEMKNFVLPGGHTSVSACHLARVVCRRAERRISEINEIEEVNSIILMYLNRLSDYLFVLSRHLSALFGAEEIPWRP